MADLFGHGLEPPEVNFYPSIRDLGYSADVGLLDILKNNRGKGLSLYRIGSAMLVDHCKLTVETVASARVKLDRMHSRQRS